MLMSIVPKHLFSHVFLVHFTRLCIHADIMVLFPRLIILQRTIGICFLHFTMLMSVVSKRLFSHVFLVHFTSIHVDSMSFQDR
uniref:Uncharacterized protein n=1 Tax=Triticum urartu TaxID=4572 RepID=A0A8R7U9K8_TRIUA